MNDAAPSAASPVSSRAVEPEAPEGLEGPVAMEDLVDLCRLAFPGEALLVDDLEAVFAGTDGMQSVDGRQRAEGRQRVEERQGNWVAGLDPPLTVAEGSKLLAVKDGGRTVAAAGVTTTRLGDHLSAHLQLLAVHPEHRLRGHARKLVRGAEEWALAQGADSLNVGAGAPFFLFTGVDARWTDALCTFEALGYVRTGVELDLFCRTVMARPTKHLSAGIVLAHSESDADSFDLGVWARRVYPLWASEFDRAASAGTVVIARRGGDVIGAAAHSVSRWGVVGPVAVDPSAQDAGIGSALMAAVLSDLSAGGVRSAEIAWTSTVRFYVRSCAASVGRCSVVLRRDLVKAS